jgi:hypothetical protein
MTGRQMAQHVRLPFNVTFEILRTLKAQMLVSYKASAPMGDFEHDLTETGIQRPALFRCKSSTCANFTNANWRRTRTRSTRRFTTISPACERKR